MKYGDFVLQINALSKVFTIEEALKKKKQVKKWIWPVDASQSLP